MGTFLPGAPNSLHFDSDILQALEAPYCWTR